jgi:tRNA (adenine22-N1)-methyltransferase
MKKISKRLQKIDSMVSDHYQDIWDCCCDHGLLGLSLLKRKSAEKIHFVDIVPSLALNIEKLLQQHFSSMHYAQQWQVHCIDVAKIPLTEQNKQLVIIAGVGGELLISFVENIIREYRHKYPNNSTGWLEFILCPVHHNYQVRQTLIKHNFMLVDECIITENKRSYEIIHAKVHISNKLGKPEYASRLSPVGNEMWDFSLNEHQEYLTKTINHYQRMMLAASPSKHNKIQTIIEQYSLLLPIVNT